MGLVSCAACNDGAAHCWGVSSSGVLVGRGGRGFSDVVRIDSVNDAEMIENDYLIACVLRRGGKVACWGEWDDRLSRALSPRAQLLAKELREVPLPHAATELAVGGYHACALLSTDEVACWGRNEWGQVGVMSDASSTALPRILPGLRAQRLVVSGGVSCAIDLKKRVWCWGWNGGGAMGTGDSEQHFGPVLIKGISGVVKLVTHAGRVCAQTMKGEIWCWGGEDESGFSGKTPLPSIRRAPTGQLAAVDEETFSVIARDGAVHVVALDGSTSNKVDELPPVQSMASGNEGSCAILTSGALRCWGTNLRGEIVVAQKKAPQ